MREGELKGLEKGRDTGMRQSIEAVVQMRFPALLDLTKEQIKDLHNPDTLQMVLVALVSASTERDARSYLLTLHADQ